MLKVVGASWYRTKISSLILLSALLLAIGALFILNIERPRLESVYCATAYWNPSTGYHVEFWGQGHNLEKIPRGVARVCYKSASDGQWPHMEVESNAVYADNVQAFSAGILEGSLLWKSIYLQWMEALVDPCEVDDKSKRYCAWLRGIVAQNYESTKRQIEGRLKGHIDSYWYQIHLFYQQLEGIEFGWRHGLKRSPMKRSGLEIPFTDLLILNLGADLKLLQDYYNNRVVQGDEEGKVEFLSRPKQTIRLKMEADSDQIKLSLDHQVHDTTESPYRVLKKYKLNYRLAPASKLTKHNAIVPGHNIVLTSFSGVISSPDEFYAVTGRHSRLTVAGIDLKYEPKLQADLQNVLFLSVRVMAANRLATSSRTWAKLMKRDPHGAKQWLLVDRKILHSYNSFVTDTKQTELMDAIVDDRQIVEEGSSLADRIAGLIWVIDNVPGRMHGEDVTERTLEVKTLRLGGTPHFKETFAESGLIAKDDGLEFEYLKQSEGEPAYSVRFYAAASSTLDYMEGMTVIHSDDQEDNGTSGNNNGDIDGGSAAGGFETERANSGLSFSLEGFSSKWTWA